MSKINVLFLHKPASNFVGAILDYTKAFELYSRHNIFFHDSAQKISKNMLKGFDSVIFDFCSIFSLHTGIPEIEKFNGLKIGIIQDEYASAIRNRNNLVKLNLDCIVTNIPDPENYRKVYYGDEFANTDFIHALTGYVADYMLYAPSPIPFAARKWVIGYRATALPYRYGMLGREKYLIGARMNEICKTRNINANIALDFESKFFGNAWQDFIRDCRVMLGTESGSNVFDFDNSMTLAIDNYMRSHPDADFDSIYELFIKYHDGKIIMNQISPRIFETISLKTGMILFEGKYSGIIEPWKHYIPLKKDFSNIDEVLDATNNIRFLEEMTNCAYKEVIASRKYSYSSLVERIDNYIANNVKFAKNLEPICMLAGWRDTENNSKFLLKTSKVPYQEVLLHNDSIVSDSGFISKIFKTHGRWKFIVFYYKHKDKMFPPGSIIRKIGRKIKYFFYTLKS